MTVQFIQMKHDDYCPAIIDQSVSSCVCNPEVTKVNETSWVQGFAKSRKDRREAQRQAEKFLKKMRKS